MVGIIEPQHIAGIDKYIQVLYDSCMATKIINISLPEELVKKVDAAAKAEYSSRSDYIRSSLVSRLRSEELDEWGDRALDWNTGVDLRDNNGNGMDVQEFATQVRKAKKSK